MPLSCSSCQLLQPGGKGSTASREFDKAVRGIQGGFNGGANLIAGRLAAPEQLELAAIKVHVNKYGYEIFAKSVNPIKVFQHAGEAAIYSLLDCFESSGGGSEERTIPGGGPGRR